MNIQQIDPEISVAIFNELQRQNQHLELIASENFASLAVMEAQGSVLTNKYAEGYPSARWYGGCEYVDVVERLAIARAKELFGAEHANVQPHSGTQANTAVYTAMLQPGDTLLALDLACGGHLSHGHPLNVSGKFFKFVSYGVNRKTEQLDYDEIASLAREHKPKMIVAGASAYPRTIDFARFREIADEVGAYLFTDMAHIAGLVAAGEHPSPLPYSEFVTTTTHKTLRGPRGGLILCGESFKKEINREVFPGIQGGPLMHVIAAKAVALKEAQSPEFKQYQKQVVKNAKTLAAGLESLGYRIVAGGTDNHLMLVDIGVKGLTGKDATVWLGQAQITVNKNLIPYDTQSPMVTSGIRLGTPALTTRGMKEAEMKAIAGLIGKVLDARGEESVVTEVAGQVNEIVEQFPLYPELV
ncbi:MAG: serine hydroxymethyltransferase [Candidatus Omnitrophica bacterium]|nr:serine hydroxymethyltransferase [Candidatus Omnitrophota bacterium]